MAKALQTVGKVAGIVASIAMFIPGGQPVAAIASAVALTANVGAQIIGFPKPPVRGSVTDITIGGDQPTPYMIGDTYSGGALVHQTGYGAPINKVENPYLAMAVTYSAGGPIAGIDQYLADFDPLAFSGDEASGYFSQILFRQSSLGPLLQSTALTGPWGAIPGWGSNAKLSGKAHVLWSLKWDSKNGKYQGGAPQLGIRGRGVLTWDPRADSTWPGGSGTQRWADPANRSAFDAARATWAYTNRPGLHALRYALGTWERDLTNPTSDYVLTYGLGFPIDGVVVEDFVELENICEANDWTVSGVLLEPGDRMANLQRILAAGGAQECWKGGRLGLKVTAPRISLDTITRDDLSDGEIEVGGAVAWRDRLNAVIPKFRSPEHKWTMQQATKIIVSDLLASDGTEKLREVPIECCTDPDQAAELAMYQLYDSREAQPISLPVKPRLRHYNGGDRLTLSADLVADIGLKTGEVIVIDKQFDPGAMRGTLIVATETMEKHDLVGGVTGDVAAPIVVPKTEDYDGAATAPDASLEQLLIANSYPIGAVITATDAGSDATVSVTAHNRVYQDRTVAVSAATITGLDYETTYWLYVDDVDRAGGALTIVATEVFADAFTSSTNPARHYVGMILTPAVGGGTSTGGGGSPPGGGGYNGADIP